MSARVRSRAWKAPHHRRQSSVHIKKDDPNRAMKFEFALQAPNQWAGVGVEIHGLPDKRRQAGSRRRERL